MGAYCQKNISTIWLCFHAYCHLLFRIYNNIINTIEAVVCKPTIKIWEGQALFFPKGKIILPLVGGIFLERMSAPGSGVIRRFHERGQCDWLVWVAAI